MSNTQAQLIEIYPNPASSILRFRNAKGLSKELFSIEGKLIMRSDKSKMGIREVSPGIYMVIFKDSYGDSVQRMKVVKE